MGDSNESIRLEIYLILRVSLIHRDERLNLHLEFLWQPMVNESMLKVYKRWIERGKKGARKKTPRMIAVNLSCLRLIAPDRDLPLWLELHNKLSMRRR